MKAFFSLLISGLDLGLKSALGLTLALSLSACSSFDSNRVAGKRQFQIHELWARSTLEKDNVGFRKISRMTPLISGNMLIQANGMDGMVAYDRDSGNLVWRLPIPNGAEPSATMIKDRLFIGASDGNFYSIETKTGHVLWAFQTRAENLGEPLLEDGIVYFISGNNVVYALDASTGKQIWLFSRQDTSSFSIRGGSKPAIKDGKLFIGSSDGSLLALNSKTGTSLWEVQLNRNKKFRDIDASPVIDGDRLYIPSYDDKLYCISLAQGEILWRADGGGYSAVTMVDDKLIYPTSTGEVLALRRSNGEKLWSFKVTNGSGIATQVKLLKGLLVFGESQGKIQFLDANTGRLIGGFEPGRGILSAPQIDEKKNQIFFISGEANVYALEAKWARPDWYFWGNQ